MPTNEEREAFRFAGFASPTYTQIPDEFFDAVAPFLAEAELRVLLYLMRRTFGFKREADDVSLKQLVSGITKRDGGQLDHGTGLSKSSVVRGLAGLEQKGLIVARRNADKAHGDRPTTYALRMLGDPLTRVSQSDTGGAASGTTPVPPAGHPRVLQRDTQETVVQETVGQEDPPAREETPEDRLARFETEAARLRRVNRLLGAGR